MDYHKVRAITDAIEKRFKQLDDMLGEYERIEEDDYVRLCMPLHLALLELARGANVEEDVADPDQRLPNPPPNP